MLLNYVRIAFRTFFKNKVAFIINLLGMSIALGCCITAFVNYEFNAGFDEQQRHASDLYRIGFYEETEKGKIPYGVCPMPVGNLVRDNLKEGEQLIQYISKSAQFRIGDEMFEKELVYADPLFTSVFYIHLLSGKTSLAEKTDVLISDKLALTYFGNTDVLGKSLTQIISGQPRELTIAGVYRAFPANSSFRFDLLATYDNYFPDPAQKSAIENNWARWTTAFLYVKNKNTIDAITKQLSKFVEPQNEARPDLQVNSYYIEPFVGMAMRAVREKNQGHWLNMPMPPAAVIAPFAMAGFLLLVACFNFMNNAISVAATRLKEIGIRKVIGGRRKELIIQFLSETMVFCLLALVVSLFLAKYFVARWDAMWPGIELSISYRDNTALLVAISLLMMVTALLAGGYPAFYISAFRPIEILKGNTRFGSANLLTKSLLVFQFSISLAAVIFALAFYFNARFQKEFDLGYSYQSVIQVPIDNPAQFDPLKNALSTQPMIRSVGGSQHHIYSSSYSAAARAGNQAQKKIDLINVGDDYFETVNVRLISGHGFEKDQASDLSEAIIVNQEFIRVFALEKDPIGKRITLNDTIHVYIKGIVKDVYLSALFQPLSPVAFRYVAADQYRYLVASTDPQQLAEVNAVIKREWKKLFPNVLYTGRLMEQRMVMAMEHFDNAVILYTFLGIVAIIMSVSGLYSLISLHLQKRTKELGIRKILGAPLPHLMLQASKLFLMIMTVSFVAGCALGSVMVNALMNNIWAYYEAIGIKVLSLAVVILFTIAVITILYKIVRIMVTNPVEALRHE
jgi:putative ABC transport system permease protein